MCSRVQAFAGNSTAFLLAAAEPTKQGCTVHVYCPGMPGLQMFPPCLLAYKSPSLPAAGAPPPLQAVLQLVLVERRVLCATLHVDVSNAAALGLYRKAGFQEVRPFG